VRGVNWLGDAVMTTPALLRLRERFPEAHIALLTADKLRDVWMHHPAINETILFSPADSALSVGRTLRSGGFDLALILPNSPRSAIETWLARIPDRVGYSRPWRTLFLTRAVSPRAGAVKMHKRSKAAIEALTSGRTADLRETGSVAGKNSVHQIHEYLHLTSTLGADPEIIPPQLFLDRAEVQAADDAFLSPLRFAFSRARSDSITPQFVAVCPSAEYGPAKRWPMEKFSEVIRETSKRGDCHWLILGGKADHALGEALSRQTGMGATNLAGATTLRELMALLKLCRVLLTNDTGPMHVAAAVGTPVVVPFGSTSPELTGPGLPGDPRHQLLKSSAPCAPCFLRECPIDFRCMKSISTEAVTAAVLKVIMQKN
jgi:heptosyltransferase-2